MKSAKSIFLSAIEIQSANERATYVASQCREDGKLAAEVQRLLDNQPKDSFMESPVAPDLAATVDKKPDTHPTRQVIGQQIGPYKIRELIGEGGMGSVYVAEQERPLRRKVAVKVIKPGMDSKAVLGRFEAERNALALMNHPNIARVLEAGTTNDGHPYFVMELVNGIPITEYCDEQKLTIRQRLDLFIDVCRAIQHAHQKGVIHRDVKPSNVLVTELDGNPIAKVIDFGVAKALNQSLTEESIYTAFQTVVGTPLYMSPEQASFSAVDVDTRSDVYSLGVLLYELITGTTPFSQHDLKQAAQEEVFRWIRELEPPRPSNRISSLGKTATRISQSRCAQPEQLGRIVKGDLDWIVMKAICKERGRRYDSANRFAEDVERYLNNDLVEARPPSIRYQLAKLYRRNRSLVTAAMIAFTALLVMLGAVLYTNRVQARLLEENRRLVVTLRQNRSENIFEAVLQGDTESAKRDLAVYKESLLGDADERLPLLEALVKAFGTDAERLGANKQLSMLDKQYPDDLTTKSLLLASHLGVGDEWSYFKSIGKLHDLEATTFEEYLLRGNAYYFSFPERAIDDLSKAIALKRSSAVAHVLLARSYHHAALKQLDPHRQLELATKAAHRVMLSREILPNGNILALLTYLDTQTGLIEAQFRNRVTLQETEMQHCVEQLLKGLRESQDLVVYDWRIHTAELDALKILTNRGVELHDDLMQHILRTPEGGENVGEPAIKLIQWYYRRGNLDKCRELSMQFDSAIIGYSDLALLPQIELAVQNGVALESVRAPIQNRFLQDENDSEISGFHNWLLLKLLDSGELADSRLKENLAFGLENLHVFPDARERIAALQRMLGKTSVSNDEIVAQSLNGESRIGNAFGLAILELSAGNRSEAKRLFQKVVESPQYRFFNHGWAEAFLQRIDDDKWLPWLPPNS